MESSDCDSESAKKSDLPCDYANTDQMKMDTDVSLAPCGCNVTEDCGTTCENCIKNYIQTVIENSSNPNILPCLKSMCHAKKRIGVKMENVIHQRESVIRHSNAIKQEQEFQPQKSYDSMSDILEMKPNLNESFVLEEDKATTRDTEQTENQSKIKSKETVRIKDSNTSIEQGHSEVKKSMKLDETSSEDSLAISEDDNGASNICGSCKGCTTDCGDCWACIQKDVVATNDLTSSMISQKNKCHAVKEVSKHQIKKENEKKVKIQPRKRCGTCQGCIVAQNCGICAQCVRKERFKIEGKKFKGICNARKCHKLKTPAGKRCGDCEGCQSQSCGNCSFCIGGNLRLCLSKRCQNRIYGPGVKIKPNVSILDTKINRKKPKVDDNDSRMDIDKLSIDQTTKHNMVENWLDENIQSEENRDKKDANSKSVKRIKRCGLCFSCQAKDCGDCGSCQINKNYGDNLVLGKVACSANRCETPVELAGDLDAMMLQDDSSNGAVCPVKIIDGVLYDFRCFFCKKLPRAGSVNRSELMRHYSTVHYAEQIKEDFELCVVEGHCLLCEAKLKNHSMISHIGQKHNEVVSYLPPEAVDLCPEVVQKEQMGRGHPKAPVVKKKKKSSAKVKDWPQIPDGFNPSSRDRNWKGSSSGDSDAETEENCEVVDGCIIEHFVNSDEEPPFNEDSSPDYSGVGGRCSVCQREFDEVTAACLHLHEDHDIQGGSSYLMRDCENFIKSGFILVSKVQSEIVPTTNQDKAGENSLPLSDNSDSGGYLDFEAKRYVARKSTGKKSRSS